MEPLGIETISLQPHPPFYATLEQMLAPLEAIVVASTQCLEKDQHAYYARYMNAYRLIWIDCKSEVICRDDKKFIN